MATASSYTIAPLSPETWPAFDALVQRHNGIFGGCWCIWFHPDGPERGQEPRHVLDVLEVPGRELAPGDPLADGPVAGAAIEEPGARHLRDRRVEALADGDHLRPGARSVLAGNVLPAAPAVVRTREA